MTNSDPVKLFLAGDVMLGRGVDQILPRPTDPRLHERMVSSAIRYVELAEATNGPIERPVGFDYVWGEALAELDRVCPDVGIVNLETAITTSDDFSPKGINYRMSPANAACLTAAGIDCCVLANNHVLDWGHGGLSDTLATLARFGIATAGAGRNLYEAQAPAIMAAGAKGRVLVFAFGLGDSGIPPSWGATTERAGVNRLPDLSDATRGRIAAQVTAVKRPGDIVVASIHWGCNWGYEVPAEQIEFAHGLVDKAGVDCVHGHSCHHAKGIEIYKNKLILFGCGDFIDDYEGISGYEAFRDDLVLMYLPTIDMANSRLVALEMAPFQVRNMQLKRTSEHDAVWLKNILNRESQRFGLKLRLDDDKCLRPN